MWDFKLKKTRIIFIGSTVYSWLVYWSLASNFGNYSDWTYSNADPLVWFLVTSPIWIYWIVIPIYRWMMKGK
jgi:hypothetical protein